MAPVLSMSGYFSDHMHRCRDKWSPLPFSAFRTPVIFFFLMTVFCFFGHAAHGNLVLWPQVEPKPPVVEAPHPNHRTARKFLPPHTFSLLRVCPQRYLTLTEFPKMRPIVTISYKMPSYDTEFLAAYLGQSTKKPPSSWTAIQWCIWSFWSLRTAPAKAETQHLNFQVIWIKNS